VPFIIEPEAKESENKARAKRGFSGCLFLLVALAIMCAYVAGVVVGRFS